MLILPTTDRRQARRRQAVLNAFVSLLMEKRYDEIQTAEIARRADVGRSTFYRLFRNKYELLESSMEWILVVIADASLRREPPHALAAVVDHLWAKRQLARQLLQQPIPTNLRRALAAQLESRLKTIPSLTAGAPASHRAVQIAGAQIAFLEAWLKGELTASRDQAVERLLAATAL